MNRWKRNMRFWGKTMLENLGLILLISFILLVFIGTEAAPKDGGWGNTLRSALHSYPYYLTMTGGFLMLVAVLGYFQTYVPLLLSFNCRRKNVILGIMGSMSVTILSTILIAVLIFLATSTDMKLHDVSVILLLGGIMFLESGIGLIFCGIYTKWGKNSMILYTILIAICSAGFGIVLSIKDNIHFADFLSSFSYSWLVLAAGILFFMICGKFCIMVTKKLEIRG